MEDFDIINNEFLKPKNYKNTNNSTYELYNRFDFLNFTDNENTNDKNNESDTQSETESNTETDNETETENENKNEIKNETKTENETENETENKSKNSYVYVMSINNFPYYVFKNKKQAREKLIELAHYYIETLTDTYSNLYNIRLSITNEGYEFSKSYKYSIFNYEEKILFLKYNKVKTNLNI